MPEVDLHMTEEEQLKAMRLMIQVVAAGEDIFKDESLYEDLWKLLGQKAERLAIVVSMIHLFVDEYGARTGLKPVGDVPPPEQGGGRVN